MAKGKPIPSLIRTRVAQLRKEIDRHRYLYHVFDRPEISDAALDSLKRELTELEARYPQLVTLDSPTQRVGGEARKEFRKVRHTVPMLSLNDAFSKDEFSAWLSRICKIDAAFDRSGFYAEMKMDGLAIALEYRHEVLAAGSTRGNGVIGEDVAANLRTIEAIPLRLRSRDAAAAALAHVGFTKLAKKLPKPFPGVIEVRGEAFLTKAEFQRINTGQKRARLPLYANPRNVAAGSIRQLNPKITAARKLDFFAYDILAELGQETHEEAHALLSALGFKTSAHNRRIDDAEEIVAYRDTWEGKRETLPYEIDGLVITVNSLAAFRKLGVVGKAPRGAVAFKFAFREATTVVEGISVQVGRTGAVTPVAVLKPVEVGGVTIRHATLHNAEEVKRLDVRIGDTVIVGRAGDVIPKIQKVLVNLRPKNARPYAIPARCPVCKGRLKRDTNGIILRCVNEKCPARHRENLYHAVSKAAFDIVGLGPETIDKLVDAGMVHDAADIFSLSRDDFLQIEGFAPVSAEKAVASIASRTHISLPRFLIALGIPHVGEETAEVLARRFHTISQLLKASEEDLRQIPDIGPIVAKAIRDWFHDKKNRVLSEKFRRSGVHIFGAVPTGKTQTLAGKTVVFTGELSGMSRDDAKRLAREHGADVSESVGKGTSFVVVGENPGSKFEKAKQVGVRTLTESEFFKILGK